MAKKQKKIEAKRLPTKQQLSRWERQKKMQRIILISGCVFFALVIIIVGYGYYDAKVKPFGQKVLRVNDKVIDMNYYLEWLNIFLRGVDAARAPLMADMVMGTIARDQLILQRASSLGITVSDTELESELRKQQLPATELYRDVYGAKILSDRLLSAYFDSRVPTTARQANVQAMFLESMEAADNVLNMLNANESFIQLAKRFSAEDFTRERSGELGWIVDGLENLSNGEFSNSLLDDIAFSIAVGTLSKPMYDPSMVKKGGYWLLEVTERDKDKSNRVRGILLGSEAEAIEVKSKLASGANFAELAKEKSQHLESKDFGGDLGWVQKGYGNDVVVKAAFELPVGALSNPLLDKTAQTKGGYWLVKVIERDDNRQLDKEAREQLKSKALQDWLEEEGKSSTIEQYLDEQQKAWAVQYTLKKLEVKNK